MSKTKITFRQRAIILMLIENGAYPKRIKDIAYALGISSRTVLRELVFVEKFLFEENIKFVKKSGVGIFIDEDLNKLNYLKNFLDKKYLVNGISKNERVLSILESILEGNSVIKSVYFLNRFKISYATFIKDLNYLRGILKKFNLDLIQRKGIGIYINGPEEKIREVISYLIYEKFSGKNLFLNIKNILDFKYEEILKFIDRDMVNKCSLIVDKAFEKFNLDFSEKAYTSVVVHLSLCIYRMKKDLYCEFSEKALGELNKCFEFNISNFIMEEAKKKFSVNENLSEVCYITMHLRAHSISRKNFNSNDFDFENLDNVKIAGDIIGRVEKILGISLSDCVGLVKNLSIHLGPSINRLMMNMNIRNPFLDMIKSEYRDIFNATYLACEVLEKIVFSRIPESEVAYITMHIVAAYESKKKLKFTHRVLICCETGMGVSRFLSNKIMSNFPNILVVGVVSSSKIIEEIKNYRADFVISTVDIENYENYIKVSPRFTFNDIALINKMISNNSPMNLEFKDEDNREEEFINIDFINEMGSLVKLIKQDFKIGKLSASGGLEGLVQEFAFKTLDKYADEIFLEILNREKLSSTFVKELDLILLHTISEFSEKIFIGSYFLNSNMKIYDGVVKVIFYFVIPKKLNTKILRDIIGELTSSLVKDNNFTNLVKSFDENEVRKYIERILNNYYVSELKEYINKFERFHKVKEDF